MSYVDGLQRRVLLACEHAHHVSGSQDARMLERRLIDLRCEIATAGYSRSKRHRLVTVCRDALAAARQAKHCSGAARRPMRIAGRDPDGPAGKPLADNQDAWLEQLSSWSRSRSSTTVV